MSEPFEVVRHPTARRIRLSLDPASGVARLVVPKRAALKPALAWAQGKADWIAQQRRLWEARFEALDAVVEDLKAKAKIDGPDR